MKKLAACLLCSMALCLSGCATVPSWLSWGNAAMVAGGAVVGAGSVKAADVITGDESVEVQTANGPVSIPGKIINSGRPALRKWIAKEHPELAGISSTIGDRIFGPLESGVIARGFPAGFGTNRTETIVLQVVTNTLLRVVLTPIPPPTPPAIVTDTKIGTGASMDPLPLPIPVPVITNAPPVEPPSDEPPPVDPPSDRPPFGEVDE